MIESRRHCSAPRRLCSRRPADIQARGRRDRIWQDVHYKRHGPCCWGTRSLRFRERRTVRPGDQEEFEEALQTVTFRYKHQLDPEAIPQFGLVAEEVEKVNPDLVAREADGNPYTVRYDAVNAMLLNEFLKEHHKNEEQAATVARLQTQVEALTAGLQKVSAQLATGRVRPIGGRSSPRDESVRLADLN